MLFVEQDALAREFCILILDDEGYAKEIYHHKTKQTYILSAISELNPKSTIQWRHKK